MKLRWLTKPPKRIVKQKSRRKGFLSPIDLDEDVTCYYKPRLQFFDEDSFTWHDVPSVESQDDTSDDFIQKLNKWSQK